MGRLTVIKTLDDGPPYRGVVPLVDGGIAADLAEYFVSSEQTPTAVRIGEFVGPDGIRACGGVMVQALPDCDDIALERVIQRLDALPPIGTLYEEGVGPSALLDRLFDNFEPLASYPVKTQCNCTRENFARRLVALGDSEIFSRRMKVRVECHFAKAIRLTLNKSRSSLRGTTLFPR